MLLVLLMEMALFSFSMSSQICVMGTMWTNEKILRTYSLTGQVRKNNVTTDVQYYRNYTTILMCKTPKPTK